MNRKKILITLLIITILILCVIIGVIGFYYFVVYNGNNPKNIVKTFLNSYINQDELVFTELLADSTSFEGLVEFTQFTKTMSKSMSYKIYSYEKINDNTYLVKVEIKNLDFAKIFNDTIEDLKKISPKYTSDELSEALDKNLENENAPKKSFKIDIYLSYEDSCYKIKMTPELSDALLGGFSSYITQYTEE